MPRLAVILSSFGVFVTYILSVAHFLALSVPCGSSSGCDIVATSRYARVHGIPVAFAGFGLFVFLAVATLRYRRTRSPAWLTAGFAAASSGAVVNCVFTYIAFAVLHAECVWCIASNAAYVCVALTTGRMLTCRGPAGPMARAGDGVCAAVGYGLMVLAVGMTAHLVVFATPLEGDAPERLGDLTVVDLVPTDSLALPGSPEADTYVIFVDLQCLLCHAALAGAENRHKHDRNRIVVRDLPLSVHKGSYRLAVLLQTARLKHLGWQYLRACENCEGTLDDYEELAARTGVIPISQEFESLATRAVDRDLALARRLGLRHTPTVFRIDKAGHISYVSLPEFLD